VRGSVLLDCTVGENARVLDSILASGTAVAAGAEVAGTVAAGGEIAEI